MNDNDAQKEISDLFGIIQGIIPCDKKLTNQEKLDLIYIRETKLEEKIEAIEKEIGLIDFVWDSETEGLRLEWKVLHHIRDILEK